jgi:hypothetical protein
MSAVHSSVVEWQQQPEVEEVVTKKKYKREGKGLLVNVSMICVEGWVYVLPLSGCPLLILTNNCFVVAKNNKTQNTTTAHNNTK